MCGKENLEAGLPHEHDIFDPSPLEAAFKRPTHLAPLCFGTYFWRDNYSRKDQDFDSPYRWPATEDPITAAFRDCRA